MGNIVLLDDLTINKIAAGEVIERPASAVKELVENSIDAGATKIDVEIKNGGISYIRVTDNGKGIMKDDMEIAFERHATSKIREAKDLETVKSMGFRGEALASIAAISKITMQSKTQDIDSGNQIIVEGGNILSQEEIGCPQGTSITIENLFYNTPVRYKFLRKDFTEAGYIEDAITRIALIHPEIAIKLISSGKTVIQTSGNNDIKSVIYGIYGKDIAENILNVNYEYEDIKVTGVIGKPEIARSNRSNQLFFVNARYVKDKILNSSSEQAFKGLIESGKFPFLVLNIEMDPQKVDVNVHPAKLEVRFAEEQNVFRAVYHAIKDSLIKNKLIDEKENTEDIKLEPEKPQYNSFIKSNIEEKQENNLEERGFFKKFLSVNKDEESPKTNIIEQLYESRKQNEEKNNSYENNNMSSIMGKMDEMRKTVEKFAEEEYEKKKLENEKRVKELETEIKKQEEINKKKQEEELKKTQEEEEKLEKKQEEKNKITTEDFGETQVISNYDIQKEIQKQEEYIAEIQKEFLGGTDQHENKEEIEDYNQNEQQEEAEEEKEVAEIGEKLEQEESEKIEEETNEQIESKNEEIEEQRDSKESGDDNEEIANQKEKDKNDKDRDKEKLKENLIAEVYSRIQQQKAEEQEETPKEFEEMYTSVFGKAPVSHESEVNEEPETYKIPAAEELLTNENISLFGKESNKNIPKYRFIGVAFNSYIIIEIEKELYIIDERAAGEKVVYERLRKSYYEKNDKDSQLMLLPDIINLSYKEMNIAKDNMAMFEKAGFMLEEFGNNTIKLYGVPSICIDLDTKELFLEILKEINKIARTDTEEVEKKFISTIAKSVVQNTKPLTSKEEIDQLIEELFAMPNSLKSSEGIPICMKMTRFDIEKKFSRR